MKQKKKTAANRTGASFQQRNVHSDKLSAYKDSELPGTIFKTSTDNPGRADTELKRLVGGDVFRSASKTIKQTNSNPRRLR